MASILDLESGRQVKVFAKATGETAFPENDKGEVQIAAVFEISSNDVDYGGQYITWYQRLVDDKNMEYAWKALRACGVSGDDISDLRGIDRNEVELVIAARTYQDKRYVEVKYINAPGGPRLNVQKAASASKLKALSAQARAAAVKTRGASAAPAPVAAPPTFAPAPASPSPVPPLGDDGTSFDTSQFEEPQY